jgi:GNAT superfamily N-acetyltransferase
MFYQRGGPNSAGSEAARQEQNRRDHRARVRSGHAHGVLVYRRGIPVGWCQYGRREDLPRVERGRKYRALAARLRALPRWRITCFFVDRPQRRLGVARSALHAALRAIARRGGGVVEAYPATHGRAVGIWFGTVSMFEREGFRTVAPFGRSNVLMRRTVPSARRRIPARASPRPGRAKSSRP